MPILNILGKFLAYMYSVHTILGIMIMLLVSHLPWWTLLLRNWTVEFCSTANRVLLFFCAGLSISRRRLMLLCMSPPKSFMFAFLSHAHLRGHARVRHGQVDQLLCRQVQQCHELAYSHAPTSGQRRVHIYVEWRKIQSTFLMQVWVAMDTYTCICTCILLGRVIDCTC